MRYRVISSILVAAMLSVCFASGATSQPANMIGDTTFDAIGASGSWGVLALDPASVSAAKDSSAPKDHPAMIITIPKVDGTDWHVHAYCAGLSIAKGSVYQFSFTGKASAERDVSLVLQNSVPPFNQLSNSEKVTLSSAAKMQTVTLTATDDCTTAKIDIIVGQAAGTVTVSDVSLIKQQ